MSVCMAFAFNQPLRLNKNDLSHCLKSEYFSDLDQSSYGSGPTISVSVYIIFRYMEYRIRGSIRAKCTKRESLKYFEQDSFYCLPLLFLELVHDQS